MARSEHGKASWCEASSQEHAHTLLERMDASTAGGRGAAVVAERRAGGWWQRSGGGGGQWAAATVAAAAGRRLRWATWTAPTQPAKVWH